MKSLGQNQNRNYTSISSYCLSAATLETRWGKVSTISYTWEVLQEPWRTKGVRAFQGLYAGMYCSAKKVWERTQKLAISKQLQTHVTAKREKCVGTLFPRVPALLHLWFEVRVMHFL